MPVVATNDVRFLKRDDFESHEARVCIQDGTLLADASRPRRYSEEQYLRSPAEMAELFADMPEALENSVEIAQRLNLEIRLGKASLPAYPVPAGQSTEDLLRAGGAQGPRGAARRSGRDAGCGDRARGLRRSASAPSST